MKKTFISLLVLMLLFTIPASAATFVKETTELDLPEITVEFDSLQYEGNWWTFDNSNMQLYVPSDWAEDTDLMVGEADYEYALSAEDGSSFINIRAFLDDSANDYATRFEEMVEEIESSDASSEVSPARLNGVDMISYVIGEDIGLGIVILTDDAFLMVETAPGTDENAALFLQIMSTFSLDAE